MGTIKWFIRTRIGAGKARHAYVLAVWAVVEAHEALDFERRIR